MDYGEVIAAFADALRGRGIIPDKIIGDHQGHRCDVEGGKRGNKDGWYVLHLDGDPIGMFQNWRDGQPFSYFHPKRGQPRTEAERRAYKTRMDALARARGQCGQQRNADAAIEALDRWRKATPALDSHPYADSKKISVRGLREERGHLVIPVLRPDSTLQSLQFIYPDGKKRFLTGGKVEGGFFILGEPKDRLCVAEGFATAASIHQATGLACAVVFNAGNILPAARHLKKLNCRLIFCADDDWKTDGNPGRTKATEAAAKFDGLIAVPEFSADRQEKWTDFNDQANAYGAESIAAVIAKAQSAKPRLEPTVAEEQQPEPAPDPEPGQEIEPSAYARRTSLGLELQANGQAIINVANAARVLENDENLKDIVWFDEFLNRMLTGNRLLAEGAPREWTDADDINLCIYMQTQLGMQKMTVQTVSHAVAVHARRHKRNCVLDWLLTLVWDGKQRLDSFFPAHFGAEDNVYTRAVSRNFWLSIAARILKPGCKVDTMVVLEGEQGRGKSKALHAIGQEHFGEQHESVSGKGFFETIQGKYLIEIGEMDAFNRSEVSKVKQVITCQSDRYREPYARNAEDHPRQCIFVGTTNRTDWNRDETGARRFWPIACQGEIDVAGIVRDREQLFAEAAKAVMAGENWWAVPTIETEAEQRERYNYDIWHEPVAHWLEMESYRHVTVPQILAGALSIVSEEKRDDKMARRVGNILRLEGWEKTTSRRLSAEKKPTSCWRKKPPKKEPST